MTDVLADKFLWVARALGLVKKELSSDEIKKGMKDAVDIEGTNAWKANKLGMSLEEWKKHNAAKNQSTSPTVNASSGGTSISRHAPGMESEEWYTTELKRYESIRQEWLDELDRKRASELMDLDNYYREKKDIMTTGLQNEIFLLSEQRKVAAQNTETSDVDLMQMDAEIEARKKMLENVLKEIDHAKEMDNRRAQESAARSAGVIASAGRDTERTKLEAEYANGTIAMEEYYSRRQRLTQEAINQEIKLLEIQKSHATTVEQLGQINASIYAKQEELKRSSMQTERDLQEAQKERSKTVESILAQAAERQMDENEKLVARQKEEMASLIDAGGNADQQKKLSLFHQLERIQPTDNTISSQGTWSGDVAARGIKAGGERVLEQQLEIQRNIADSTQKTAEKLENLSLGLT
ncbi:MAG: hypothetical protein JXR97_09335 [Planctomycetes bacterium]|nr:hypothetical protein [Planctomycetota bacterium]